MTYHAPTYLDDADEQEREALADEPEANTESMRIFYAEDGEFSRRLGYA